MANLTISVSDEVLKRACMRVLQENCHKPNRDGLWKLTVAQVQESSTSCSKVRITLTTRAAAASAGSSRPTI